MIGLLSPLRRRWAVLLVVVVAAAALFVVPVPVAPVQAEAAPFVTGSGAASATVTKARIFYAGYALTFPLGLSATTYENQQSRALGGAYDLTGVTGLASAKAPEQVAPISVDSNAGDAAKTSDVGAGPVLGRIALSARAVPQADSEVRLADVDLTGLVRVEGGHTHATSGVVDGKVRRAAASSTVGSLSIAGGLVVLEGLRWDVVQRSGGATQADATFALGRVLIGGVPIAVDLHDLDPVLDAIDTALAPVGLVLEAPKAVRGKDGTVEMTPLRVGLVNSPIGAQVLGPLVAGIRPLLLPVFEALTAADDSLGLTALVGDLALGVADGSGGVELAIGGATARTDDTIFADPLGGVTPGVPTLSPGLTPAAPTLGGLPPAPSTASPVEGEPGATRLVPASAGGPARCVLVASPSRRGACRGTNIPGAVGVVALVVAGLLAYDALLRRRSDAAATAGGPS